MTIKVEAGVAFFELLAFFVVGPSAIDRIIQRFEPAASRSRCVQRGSPFGSSFPRGSLIHEWHLLSDIRN